MLRKYEVIQKLGKGAYGIVWRAMDKKTREVVALKKIFDAFQNSTDAQRTFREIMFLQVRRPSGLRLGPHAQALIRPSPRSGLQPCSARACRVLLCTLRPAPPPCAAALPHRCACLAPLQEMAGHDHIVTLVNCLKADNDRDIYLVFEIMETDLHAAIRANILQDIHKQYITWQTLKALKYMRSAGLTCGRPGERHRTGQRRGSPPAGPCWVGLGQRSVRDGGFSAALVGTSGTRPTCSTVT